MDLEQIIEHLKRERDRLDAALAALSGAGSGRRGPGRPAGNGRRHMSAAARRRISAAMKRRWAERKKKSAA